MSGTSSSTEKMADKNDEDGFDDSRFSKATSNRTIQCWSKVEEFSSDFYFIALADTQLGMTQGAIDSTFLPLVGWTGEKTVEAVYEAEKEMSRLAVKYINNLQPLPAFVVVCGDLINSMPDKAKEQAAEVRDFKNIFSTLDPRIRPICLCGNHDVGDRPSPSTIELYRQRFSDDYFYFWYQGVKFFVLNTQLYKFDENAKDLAEEQDRWLDKELLELKGLNASKDNGVANSEVNVHDYRCCVLTHIPPFITEQNEGDGYFPLGKEVRLNLLKRFSKHNCTHWFSGHFHRNIENTYTDEDTGSCIECVTTAALGGNIISDEDGDPKELSGMKELRLDKDLSGMRFVFVRKRVMKHCYISLNTMASKYNCKEKNVCKKIDVAKLEREKFGLNVDDQDSSVRKIKKPKL
eukprot:g1742.t1